MLSPAYAAAQQIQSQISNINTLKGLKFLLSKNKASILIRISSPTIWVLDWDISNNTISGTLELRLDPTLRIGDEIIQTSERSFMIQDPKDKTLFSVEDQLIEMIRKSIESIN